MAVRDIVPCAYGAGMTGHPVDPSARADYEGSGLDDDDVAALADVPPLRVLERWYAEAVADERVVEPGAMVLSTVAGDGTPDARTLLLKGLDARGFTFYTNLGSAKARQLTAVPAAALVLLWHPMSRQVRVRGDVVAVPRTEAAAYFASRPRASQLSAWASRQSQPVGSRAALDEQVDRCRAELGGRPVPLPDFWGGFRVRPVSVELWAGHTTRLHDRLVFASRTGRPAPLDDAQAWGRQRLQP